MTHYRLDVGGWVQHIPDPNKWKKYFAAQVKEYGIHIKDNVVQKEEKKEETVVVKLVSDVQDTYDRAKADIKKRRKTRNRGKQQTNRNPMKDNIVKIEEPVEVKLVSEVQDAYDQAKADIKKKRKTRNRGKQQKKMKSKYKQEIKDIW